MTSGPETPGNPSLRGWRKVIPPARDRLQSQVLVWAVAPLLTVSFLFSAGLAIGTGHNAGLDMRWALGVSLTFGILVWVLRAATFPGTLCGTMICMLVVGSCSAGGRPYLLHTGLPPLMLLFVLTFLATRAGRRRKEQAGLSEPKTGRRASQVIANLGAAPLILLGADLLTSTHHGDAMILLLAALAEATADTVSSEIGQAFGGEPLLVTTLRRVPPGTDGAMTFLGTGAGIAAAALVSATGLWSMHLGWPGGTIACVAGTAGLLFDSLLGATVERRGWLGNDLVNFCSTVFAAMVALLIVAL